MELDNNNVVDIDEDFPYIPKELLERIQKDFDIRKMIWYSDDRNLLMGIQQVISYLCLLYTSPSPRDAHESRMPSSA